MNTDIFFQIQKVYYAKVANKVLAQSQIVSAPLGPDPAHPMIQVKKIFNLMRTHLIFVFIYYC